MKMDPGDMRAAAGEASEFLKSLANPHRLMIMCQLIERARSVGELAQLLGLRPATVSQHLALLRKDGLVDTRRAGQVVWYSLASVPARKILETLYDIYCGASPLCEGRADGGRTRLRTVGPKRVPSAAVPD